MVNLDNCPICGSKGLTRTKMFERMCVLVLFLLFSLLELGMF
jgi:hypothetical protein